MSERVKVIPFPVRGYPFPEYILSRARVFITHGLADAVNVHEDQARNMDQVWNNRWDDYDSVNCFDYDYAYFIEVMINLGRDPSQYSQREYIASLNSFRDELQAWCMDTEHDNANWWSAGEDPFSDEYPADFRPLGEN